MQKIITLISLISILTLTSCQSDSKDHLTLKVASGQELTISVASTEEAKTKGLSGIQDKDYKNTQGMLFLYSTDGFRRFWMPDTYFNLDIFFLDKEYVVLHIERDVKFHPGRAEPPTIPRTPPIFSRHVLELKAASSFAKEIKKGDKLKFAGKLNLLQTK